MDVIVKKNCNLGNVPIPFYTNAGTGEFLYA